MSYIKKNRNILKRRTTRTYPRDSVWQAKNGQWCHKNLAGGVNRFVTEKAAIKCKKIWTPHLSRLIKEGIFKEGDRISLKLYGDSNPFELVLGGVEGKSILFSIQGKNYSLKQIKQIVSKKINKPASSVSLNYNKTIHVPSGKSLTQVKKDYVSKMREEVEVQEDNQQPFDFFNVFKPIEEQATEESDLSDTVENVEKTNISNFRADLKKYEEAQFSVLSEMQTLSEEKTMDCYKGSLILFLSSIKGT